MKQFFNKTILIALIAALAMTSLPFASVFAAGQDDPPQIQITKERLERIWARQLRIYEQLDRADEFISRVQRLIDRAEANGKDAAAVQAALDAFAAAVKDSQPIYESMKGIVNSHQGFDKAGKVTDPEKARETIQAMREKLHEIKNTLNGTRKALRQAIKSFREANPCPQPTANP
jgi:peptidoglycan hydrolase CwlO-like protein